MAASVVCDTMTSPFEEWFSDAYRSSVLFTFSNHYGDNCEFASMSCDPDGESAYIFYEYDGEYTNITLCGRILIEHSTREIYVSDIHVDYDCEVHKYIGRFRAFKKLDKQYNIMNTVMKFFGPHWRYHLRYTTRHQKNLKKKLLKNARRFYPSLPCDLHEYIVNKAVPWVDIPLSVTYVDIENNKKLLKSNIGVEDDDKPGTYYAWGKIIAVFNPL